MSSDTQAVQAETVVRNQIRKVISEMFIDPDAAPGKDEATFDEIAQELGFSVAGAKQAVDKAISKAQWLGSRVGTDDFEILVLTAMKDYINHLNSSGELSDADVRLMLDHPDIVRELDGFREFLHNYIRRAGYKHGRSISEEAASRRKRGQAWEASVKFPDGSIETVSFVVPGRQDVGADKVHAALQKVLDSEYEPGGKPIGFHWLGPAGVNENAAASNPSLQDLVKMLNNQRLNDMEASAYSAAAKGQAGDDNSAYDVLHQAAQKRGLLGESRFLASKLPWSPTLQKDDTTALAQVLVAARNINMAGTPDQVWGIAKELGASNAHANRLKRLVRHGPSWSRVIPAYKEVRARFQEQPGKTRNSQDAWEKWLAHRSEQDVSVLSDYLERWRSSIGLSQKDQSSQARNVDSSIPKHLVRLRYHGAGSLEDLDEFKSEFVLTKVAKDKADEAFGEEWVDMKPSAVLKAIS